MRASTVLVSSLLTLLFGLPAVANAKPEINGLEAVFDGPAVRVNFQISHVFNDDVLERIHSGIPVTFKHRLDLVRSRGFPLWFDKTLAKTRISTNIAYNSLTGRYQLARTVERKLRRKRDAIEPVQDEFSTRNLDEALSYISRFEGIVVGDPSRPADSRNLRVRVESSFGRRYIWLVFPTTISTSAEVKLGVVGSAP